MRRWLTIAAGLTCTAMLAGCFGNAIKRVSEPSASIQQLEVRPDGSWSVDLRLQNFSSVPMHFEQITLAIKADDENAGSLQGAPALTVGPESADIVTLMLTPTSAARLVVADALASGRSLKYSLEGTLEARAKEGRVREYKIKRNSALSAVPGRPGVMR